MGVREMERFLEQMEVKDLRRRMILAPTPGSGSVGTRSCCWPKDGPLRVRRRPWDEIRTPSDDGPTPLARAGSAALIFEQSGGSPPPSAKRNRRS